MIYHVSHRTTVEYAAPVQLARFNLRLKPAPWPGQTLLDYDLAIDPAPQAIEEQAGPFVVNRSRMALRQPLRRLTIDSRFRIDVATDAPDPDQAVSPTVGDVRGQVLADRDLSAMGPAAYLYPSPLAPWVAGIAEWAAPLLGPDVPLLAAGRALMAAIHREFAYAGGATTVETTVDEAFRARHGVCQDFAHVMIVAARAHGLPAAYVSGFLRTLPPPGQPRLRGADATHAWVNLWCGRELGWIGFDPTNDTLARTDHIFTAMGRDYADIAPLDGVFHGGPGQVMTIAVDVDPAVPTDEPARAGGEARALAKIAE